MMVERSPYVENVGQLMADLEQAATELTKVSQKKQMPSGKELDNLIQVLNKFNTNLDPSFLESKQLVPENMSATIEKALMALQLFQLNRPEKDRVVQKNVDQAVASLFSTLTSEVNAFDKHLRDLKKYKIGQRIEKTNQSKESR